MAGYAFATFDQNYFCDVEDRMVKNCGMFDPLMPKYH